MATTEIALPVRSATLTDDSAGSAIPEIVREMTTAATDPQLAQFVARFDDTTNEYLFWQFRLPGNYKDCDESTGHYLHVLFYMASDQTDNTKKVGFTASVVKVTPRGGGGSPAGDDDEMTSLDLTNDSADTVTEYITLDHANPATNDRLYTIVLDMSDLWNDLTAGDYVIAGLRRQPEAPTLDDAVGDACVVAVSFEYPVG